VLIGEDGGAELESNSPGLVALLVHEAYQRFQFDEWTRPPSPRVSRDTTAPLRV